MTQLTVIDWKLFSFIKRELHFSLNSRGVFKKYTLIQSSPLLKLFLKMATLRNRRKLAAMSKETQGYPRNNQLQNSSAPGITEEYIAQVSEEMGEELLRNYPRKSTGQSPASWVPCPSYTNFSWTHRYGHSPEPFREYSGTPT